MKKTHLIIVSLFLITVLISSCTKSLFYISGQGDIVTKTLTLQEFDAVRSTSCIDVVIQQGDVQEVIAVGHENIIERIKTNVNNKAWDVELEPGMYNDFDLTIYITVPTLTEATISGSGNIEIDSFVNLENLYISIYGSGDIENSGAIQAESIDLNISGSGYMDLDITCNTVNTMINGSGDILLKGTTTNQFISINGSGDYRAFDNESQNTEINISGSGNTEVSVIEKFKIDIMGSGDVYYFGNPRMDINISGSGSVINKN